MLLSNMNSNKRLSTVKKEENKNREKEKERRDVEQKVAAKKCFDDEFPLFQRLLLWSGS